MINRFSFMMTNKKLISSSFYRFRFINFSNIFNDKEKVEEKIFIDKKERDLMQKLLQKLHVEEPEKTSAQTSQGQNAEIKKLEEILKKNNKSVSKELFDDILLWKKGEF